MKTSDRESNNSGQTDSDDDKRVMVSLKKEN